MRADITSSMLRHILRLVVQNGISSEHMSVGEHLHCLKQTTCHTALKWQCLSPFKIVMILFICIAVYLITHKRWAERTRWMWINTYFLIVTKNCITKRSNEGRRATKICSVMYLVLYCDDLELWRCKSVNKIYITQLYNSCAGFLKLIYSSTNYSKFCLLHDSHKAWHHLCDVPVWVQSLGPICVTTSPLCPIVSLRCCDESLPYFCCLSSSRWLQVWEIKWMKAFRWKANHIEIPCIAFSLCTWNRCSSQCNWAEAVFLCTGSVVLSSALSSLLSHRAVLKINRIWPYLCQILCWRHHQDIVCYPPSQYKHQSSTLLAAVEYLDNMIVARIGISSVNL